MGKNRGDVYLRGSFYWCWIKNAEGVWKRQTTGRRDKVAARLEKKRLERQYADPAHHAANQTTIETAVANLIAFKRNQKKAAGTIQMYEQKGGHLCRVLGRDCKLIDVTGPRVDGYIAARLEETASRHTVYKELVTLRGALKVAKRRGEFPGDIFAIMPVGFSPDYTPRTTYLTWEQLRALLGELHTRRAAHLAYVIATGGRRSEAASAVRADALAEFVHLPGTKTKKSERTIPVIEMFRELLERALRDAPGKTGLLFEPWQNARRDIIRACERAEVPPVTWNDLRRTFGSLLKQAGMHVDTLADLFGHASTAMVRRVYGQDTPESLAAEVRRQLAHLPGTTHAGSAKVQSEAKNKHNEAE